MLCRKNFNSLFLRLCINRYDLNSYVLGLSVSLMTGTPSEGILCLSGVITEKKKRIAFVYIVYFVCVSICRVCARRSLHNVACMQGPDSLLACGSRFSTSTLWMSVTELC